MVWKQTQKTTGFTAIRMWILLFGIGLFFISVAAPTDAQTEGKPTLQAPAHDRKIPDNELGKIIRLGELLVAETSTHPLTKKYVGNALNCTSCHLNNGQDPRAATFIGVATAYPAWAPREKTVITLEDRVLNCFMRSCNGTRPPLGSDASVAITAYITWLSTDMPIQMNGVRSLGPFAVPNLNLTNMKPDQSRGRLLYQEKCADCHADDGMGDESNPPVWGHRSYNDGAGLAEDSKLANWLKVSMPLDDTHLSDQDAYDIATFVNSHERPKFRLEDHLPPAEERGVYNSNSQ